MRTTCVSVEASRDYDPGRSGKFASPLSVNSADDLSISELGILGGKQAGSERTCLLIPFARKIVATVPRLRPLEAVPGQLLKSIEKVRDDTIHWSRLLDDRALGENRIGRRAV